MGGADQPVNLQELLGNELLSKSQGTVGLSALDGKYVAFYFSAHWCVWVAPTRVATGLCGRGRVCRAASGMCDCMKRPWTVCASVGCLCARPGAVVFVYRTWVAVVGPRCV